jgi:PAS domain S-box-containing protein
MSKCVVTVDSKDNTIVAASFGTVQLFGFSLAELIGANVNILMPPAFGKHHDAYIARFMASGVAHVIDKSRFVTGRRKDGNSIELKLSLSVLKLAKSTLFVGLLEPVHSNVVKIECDKNGKITACSSSVMRWFGYSKRQLIGVENVRILCSEPHRTQHDRYITQYHATGIAKVLNKVIA